jgi:thymidylate synthase
MKQYLNLLNHVLLNGEVREDRTGTGTISVFSPDKLRFDLRHGFPMVTTKYVSFHNVKAEMLWFLSGDTNIKWLQDNNCHIWDLWKLEDGTIGRGYQAQWRSWKVYSEHITDFSRMLQRNYFIKEIDQIAEVIHSIKTNPFSRRHIVSAWNVGELDQMALPPCHYAFQFYVTTDGGLSCKVQFRSNDLFLGNPYNCASFALLTHMIAQVTGLQARDLTIDIGDAHIYLNHRDQVQEQLTREPKPLPTLWLNPEIKDIDDFTMKDIKLIGYESHPAIKGEISV